MKTKLFSVLKIAGAAAGGALIADPNLQQSVAAIVPPKYAAYVGAAFGLAALFLKPPKAEKPNTR